MGLDWVLGLGSAFPPTVLAPVPLLSLPPTRECVSLAYFPFRPSASGLLQAPHHHGNKAGPLPVGLGLSGRWESRSSMSHMCIYERSCGRAHYVCTLCVRPGTWGWNCLCCCVGVNCGGFVFTPWAWGVCACVSMRPPGTDMPACVHMWSEAGFGLRPMAWVTCSKSWLPHVGLRDPGTGSSSSFA